MWTLESGASFLGQAPLARQLLHICVLETEQIARACLGLRELLAMTSWSLGLIVHRLARQPLSPRESTQRPVLHPLTAHLTVCPQVLAADPSPPLTD